MMYLYNPDTGGTLNTNGVNGVSDRMMMLNILVELRAGNLLFREIALGNFNYTIEEARTSVITNSVNPVI